LTTGTTGTTGSRPPTPTSSTRNKPAVNGDAGSELDDLEIDAHWKEFTHRTGRLFYYNSKTKESTWYKPDCLMTVDERQEQRKEECKEKAEKS